MVDNTNSGDGNAAQGQQAKLTLKSKVFEVIEPGKRASKLSSVFDWLITALILASVASVFAATFDIPDWLHSFLARFEVAAVAIFTVEYLLRIWTADLLYEDESPFVARLKYVASSMAIIDLVAILPFYLPMFLPTSMLGMRALRLVRLFRILKLNRYSDAMASIGQVLKEKRRELCGSFFFVSLLMVISSLLMYATEHDAQPLVFKNAFSGLWWAVATLTTVGYGDIYPVTAMGRVIGAFIAFLGVAAVAIPTGIISSGLMERISSENGEDCSLKDPHASAKAISARLATLDSLLAEHKITSEEYAIQRARILAEI